VVSLEYRIGDVFDRLAEIPDGSIDLIVTSPPFLALRSYLPADHPDKHKEIGSEPTPAEFIDTLLALSAEWGRVLAPHGSMCVELGDTYSSGDTGVGGTRTNNLYNTTTRYSDDWNRGNTAGKSIEGVPMNGGPGWPLAKSLTGIPTLYPWSLAYGRNLLTGQPSPAGQWRIRNVIVWARPNPPVGALGDKFRPATSYITVACRGKDRYFDLDAVRTASDLAVTAGGNMDPRNKRDDDWRTGRKPESGGVVHPAGAPPLDWHADDHPEDGDWLWKLSTQPYKGSHYATYPLTLPKRMIEAMCPLKVCTVCGRPSERVVESERIINGKPTTVDTPIFQPGRASNGGGQYSETGGASYGTNVTTIGFTDCGHDAYRTGIVLDPFAGSGTTLDAAQAVGRHAIGIDLDARNADLAQQRVGMFLTIDHGTAA
jgi:site-specific DNA-methyltransferase (adenine-specific)